VCEAYFAKDPNKIGFLRMDTLALLLSLANVGANAEVLVLDMLGGLLTAAVAERLGGHGSVCSTFHTAKAQTVDMVRLFNFDTSTASRCFPSFETPTIHSSTADFL
jgi:tRNA (adenine-N(1)-)-methyltransferase non-catalytic subunit